MDDRTERAKALKEALAADEAFAAEFKQAIDARSIEDTIRLAATKGIELTVDDFAPNAQATDGAEIDEDELRAVAGGYNWDDFLGDFVCVMNLLLATAS